MPRAPFPEQAFTSLYPLPHQNQTLLPPQLPPLSVPLPPLLVEVPVSNVQLIASRNCPYPVLEDIETFNGVNISRPFRNTSLIPDQWIKDNTSAYSDRQSVDQPESDSQAMSEGEGEEVMKITDELICSLSELLASCHHDDEENITEAKDISLTRGVLSGFFLRHLPILLNKESRNMGFQELQNTLTVFSSAVSSFKLKNMTEKERARVEKLHRRCVHFRMALSWALDDLGNKIRKNCTDLAIMGCIKAVFILVLSLYYRERGYPMDASESSERLAYPNGTEAPPSLTGINSDSVHYDAHLSVKQPEEARYEMPTSSASHTLFSQHQGIVADSNLFTNRYDEFIAQEEQVFLERRLPVSTDGALVTMFHSHIVPMTPVIARDNGRYVRGTQRTELSIMDAAYAYDTTDGGCVIPCKFVLNQTYTPENNNSTHGPRYLTYVGFLYPDKSMLSYIPIKHVRIVYEDSPHRQPILRSGTTTFAFLHMDVPNAIYQNLKILAKEVYLRKNPHMLFVDHFEELLLDGRMVRIEVLVKSERTVRIEDQGKYLDYPVLQALFHCRHDLCGKSLLHLRFTSTKRGSQRMQLRLILFGITVERNQFNYRESIFDLLNSPPGPIQTPFPVELPAVQFG